MKFGAAPVTAPFLPDPQGGEGGRLRAPTVTPIALSAAPSVSAGLSAEPTGFLWLRGPLSAAAPPSSCCCSWLEPGGLTACPLSQGAPETRWEGSGRPPSVRGLRAPVKWETGSHHPPRVVAACGSGQKLHLGLGTASSTGRAGGSEGLSCFWKVGEEHGRAGPPGLVGQGP